MYGKAFSSMYEGSMYGAGVTVFAVWNYALAFMKPVMDQEVMMVELNPRAIADRLGKVSEQEVASAIEFLCSPDPNSRSKEEEGRRLVRTGQFEYRVVNGWKYTKILNEEQRRRMNATYQKKYREKKVTLEGQGAEKVPVMEVF